VSNLRSLTAVLISLSLYACDTVVGPASDPTRPDVRDYVTGDAASALDARGRFVTPDLFNDPGWGRGSRSSLEQVTVTFLEDFIKSGTSYGQTSLRESVESDYGSPIRWDQVVALGPGMFAATPYARTPLAVPNYLRRPFGPFLVRTFGIAGDPILAIAVSVVDPVPFVDADGRISSEDSGGGEFKVAGIGDAQSSLLPPSAEAAAAFAAVTTGRLVTKVPILLRPEVSISPLGAVWKIHLDSDARLVRIANDFRVQTDSVYVSLWPNIREEQSRPSATLRLFVAAQPQPGVDSLPLSPSLADELGFSHVWHERRTGYPTRYWEVRVAGGG
jgi:hypothetical protein